MTTLTVVGVENDQLVMVSEDGQRYFVPITDALRDALRQKSSSFSATHRVSPKDIQAHIRRGLSAQQVADLTGEDVSYIEKFEGAVIAERRFIVDQALAVQVTMRGGDETTFGASIRDRLGEISASEDNWSAWKEESGWLVELSFTEGDVEHTARWSFHQRKHLLEPLNDDASVLSRHEPMPTTLIPKLSAVATSEPEPDRFDSEIFESSDLGETGPLLEPVSYGRTEEDGRMADTADLLEVLRRKRGEREPSPTSDEDSRSAHPATGGIRLVEDDSPDASITPIGGHGEPDDEDPDPTPPKKKRPEMPSWDDIVFGARSDDDPA
jgi:hypothetical protein